MPATRVRQGGGRNQAVQKQPAQGGQSAADGRGRVIDPATDGRIGNNPQANRNTGGSMALQAPQAPQQIQTNDNQLDDPRLSVASDIMDVGIHMLAIAGRIFRDIDINIGNIDANIDTQTYVQGCYDGLQSAIGEKMDELEHSQA